MKKVILTIGVLATAMIACKKKTTENPVPGIGTATIKGYVKETTSEKVVNGTTVTNTFVYAPAKNVTVMAWIDSKDLVINPSSSTYAKKVFTATTDANGMYEIKVDANLKAVNVTVQPQPFYKDFTGKNGKTVSGTFTALDTLYSNSKFETTSKDITLNNSEIKIQDFTLDADKVSRK